MKQPFEILAEIEKSELIRLFSEHEANRPIAKDQFAHDRIEDLNKSENIKFYKIKFNEAIVDHLMLPHHGHEINIIPPYGKSVNEALILFSTKELEAPDSECIVKIKNLKKYFFDDHTKDWTGDFILIGNDKDIAHPGNHYSANGNEQYFIFNGFHRLMAYFLSIKDTDKFKPLYAYYAEKKINVA